MIGEIRNPETAESVLDATLTGHSVIATDRDPFIPGTFHGVGRRDRRRAARGDSG